MGERTGDRLVSQLATGPSRARVPAAPSLREESAAATATTIEPLGVWPLAPSFRSSDGKGNDTRDRNPPSEPSRVDRDAATEAAILLSLLPPLPLGPSPPVAPLPVPSPFSLSLSPRTSAVLAPSPSPPIVLAQPQAPPGLQPITAYDHALLRGDVWRRGRSFVFEYERVQFRVHPERTDILLFSLRDLRVRALPDQWLHRLVATFENFARHAQLTTTEAGFDPALGGLLITWKIVRAWTTYALGICENAGAGPGPRREIVRAERWLWTFFREAHAKIYEGYPVTGDSTVPALVWRVWLGIDLEPPDRSMYMIAAPGPTATGRQEATAAPTPPRPTPPPPLPYPLAIPDAGAPRTLSPVRVHRSGRGSRRARGATSGARPRRLDLEDERTAATAEDATASAVTKRPTHEASQAGTRSTPGQAPELV